jgi:small subunit ribosomal protein S7
MPRKKTKALVRDVQPDRIYQSIQVQRLINRVMRDGKKQLAERLVYGGMQKSATRLKVDNPIEVFEQAFKNIQPHFETRKTESLLS